MYVFGHRDSSVRIDITNEVEAKIQAILCHKTQIQNPEEAPTRWRERWGEKQEDGSLRYFEQFKAMKFG